MTRCTATHSDLGTRLHISHAVLHGANVLLQRFQVENQREEARSLWLFFCTLWLADWYTASAKKPDDLKSAADLLEWATLRASSTSVLPEQVHPFPLALLSVAPLTWPHAQFVTTACAYLDKLTALGG